MHKPLLKGVLDNQQQKTYFEAESPLGLIGKADDATCALYLVGDTARFVTGQEFMIDGGATC